MATNLTSFHTIWKAHLLVGLLCLIFAFNTPEVAAHAALISSTPENGARLEVSPTEIVLDFNEPVGPVEGGFRLHGEESDPVDLRATSEGNAIVIQIDDPLDEGAYVVQWRVISADSHPISGTISFTIGDIGPASEIQINDSLPAWVEWGTAAAKTLSYGGMLLSLGLLIVGWMLVRSDMGVVARQVRYAAWVGAVGLLLELPLAAITQRGSMVDSLVEMWTALRQVDRNTGWSLGAGIALLIAVALASKGDLRDRDLFSMVAIMNVTAVLSLMLSGHTRTKTPTWLMLGGDAIHLFAGAVWLGGIVILTLGLTGRWKGSAFKTAQSAIEIVAGFSRMALGVAIALIVSGVTMGVVILDSWDALLNTDYGTTLMIKVGLVALTLLLAALNRFLLLPGRERNLPWLRRIVSAELVLILSVVGATGVLVQQNPTVQSLPNVPNTELFSDTVSLDDAHTVDLLVTQTGDGELEIVATIRGEDGNQIIPEADLEMSWYLPSRDLGPLEYSFPIDSATGEYQGSVTVPMGGEWRVEIRAELDRFTDSRATVEIQIAD